MGNSAGVTTSAMEVLTPAECLSYLRQAPVGRIAVTVDALPVILPVNFLVLDDEVVFRTVAGTKLAAATSHAVVAFEVDDHAADGRSGWSVMVQGMASEVTDPGRLDRIRSAGLASWALGDDVDHVVSGTMQVVAGRRFSR